MLARFPSARGYAAQVDKEQYWLPKLAPFLPLPIPVPLAIGDAQAGGGGGPAYFPMARAIIGGLAFGALVSLFFVPAFYAWLDDLGAWRRRLTVSRPAAALAAQRNSSLPTSQ